MSESSVEVFRAILKCQDSGLLERDVLSTWALMKELNRSENRSREWDAFEAGYVMADLGFEISVTPTTHQRGWKIDPGKMKALGSLIRS